MAAAPVVTLDDLLCFDLYAASRAVTARYRPLLEPLGLTYPQYLVMVVLWESGPVTMTELGTRLHLDSGTLSPLVRRLQDDGLVTKHRRVEDERSVEIALTPAGRGLKRRAAKVPEQIGRAMGLDDDGFAALRTVVRQLTTNVARS
jgi:MarR family transcriptional regulator, organic hydroperoxide resistance regulator